MWLSLDHPLPTTMKFESGSDTQRKQRESIEQGIVGECSRRENSRNRGPGP